VVPAFRPDPDRLAEYVDALAADDQFAVVRVEADDPAPAVETALADAPCETNAVAARRGKGAAITDGFEALADRVDVLAFADADGATPVSSVVDVTRPVVEGRAALSVGSRRHPDADVRTHQTLARRRLGDAFAWVARRLLATDLHDYQCGAKAVRVGAWRELRDHLHEEGFAWDVELVAVAGALGVTVAEVPVTWIDRPNSTVDPLSTPVEMSVALLRVRHRAKRIAGSPLHRAVGADTTPLVDRGRGRGESSTDD